MEKLKSRKIFALICMSLLIDITVFITTRIHTPEQVTQQALWTIGLAGLFTIGGQGLVDIACHVMKVKTDEGGGNGSKPTTGT